MWPLIKGLAALPSSFSSILVLEAFWVQLFLDALNSSLTKSKCLYVFVCFRPQSKRMASSGELYTYLYLLSLVLTNRMARTKVHAE